MSVFGLPTFLISVENMNLLSSSIYKDLKTYLIKHKQSLILGECQLAIEIYSRPVSTANGIKFSFIKMSDRDLIFFLFILSDRHVPICNRNSYT
jgi:hypothetical protein